MKRLMYCAHSWDVDREREYKSPGLLSPNYSFIVQPSPYHVTLNEECMHDGLHCAQALHDLY